MLGHAIKSVICNQMKYRISILLINYINIQLYCLKHNLIKVNSLNYDIKYFYMTFNNFYT